MLFVGNLIRNGFWAQLIIPPFVFILLVFVGSYAVGHSKVVKSLIGFTGLSNMEFENFITEQSLKLIVVITAGIYILFIIVNIDVGTTSQPSNRLDETTPDNVRVSVTPTLRSSPPVTIPTNIEIGYIEPTQITVIVRGGGDLDDLMLDSALADGRIDVLDDAAGIRDNDPFCVIYVVRGAQPSEPTICNSNSIVIPLRENNVFWYDFDARTRQEISILVADEDVGVCILNERQRCEIQVD